MLSPIQRPSRVLIAATLVPLLGGSAVADPLPSEVLKFQQLPMVATPVEGQVYHGHDELSTLVATAVPGGAALTYSGIAMADDFADPFDTPVVHVRWWGSYLNNSISADNPIDKFLIAFESDVPADQNPGGFSTPGDVLSSQIVNRGPLSPGSGTFTEKRILDLPDPGEDIYEYNAELHLGKEFEQEPETVYWIKIAALVEDDGTGVALPQWGWHNRDYTVADPFALAVTPPVLPGERDERTEVGIPYPTEVWHFQDDAVSARTDVFIDPMMPDMPLQVLQMDYAPQRYLPDFDGPAVFADAAGISYPGIGEFSKDLAFELYTRPIPEPAAVLLAAACTAAACLQRRRPTAFVPSRRPTPGSHA